jgi:hypothetical protein
MKIRVCFSSANWFGMKIRAFLISHGMVWNKITQFRVFFSFYKLVLNEIPSSLSSQDGIPSLFRSAKQTEFKIRVPFNNFFLLIKWQPCSEPMSWGVTLSNIYLFCLQKRRGSWRCGFWTQVERWNWWVTRSLFSHSSFPSSFFPPSGKKIF